jgi:hypothetical protein
MKTPLRVSCLRLGKCRSPVSAPGEGKWIM